jgi:hypothetical protein
MFQHVFLLLLSLTWLGSLCWPDPGPAPSRAAAKVRGTLHRLLKPRTPLDCPACCHASTAASGSEPAPVRPWREVKSHRGAPKRVNTAGFACPNPKCSYFVITDDQIHAAFWGWEAWSCRTHPDLSRPCVPHHVQFSAPHPIVSSENLFSADRKGTLCAGRRAGSFGGSAGLRLPAGDDHEPF